VLVTYCLQKDWQPHSVWMLEHLPDQVMTLGRGATPVSSTLRKQITMMLSADIILIAQIVEGEQVGSSIVQAHSNESTGNLHQLDDKEGKEELPPANNLEPLEAESSNAKDFFARLDPSKFVPRSKGLCVDWRHWREHPGAWSYWQQVIGDTFGHNGSEFWRPCLRIQLNAVKTSTSASTKNKTPRSKQIRTCASKASVKRSKHGTLVNRGADGGPLGNDIKFVFRRRKTVDIAGIDNHEPSSLSKVDFTTKAVTDRGPALLILCNYV